MKCVVESILNNGRHYLKSFHTSSVNLILSSKLFGIKQVYYLTQIL